MIRCKIAAVAVVLSALAAQPAFPQAAISEPGAFEVYHPNDDVLHGRMNPARRVKIGPRRNPGPAFSCSRGSTGAMGTHIFRI
jgi:hypothetical protein